jgi:hypothetical protein
LERLAAKLKVGTCAPALVDVAQDLVELLLAGYGSDFSLLIQRIPYGHFTHHFYEPAHELLGDGALNQEPAAAVAAFTLIEAHAKHCGVRRCRQIGVRENDLRVFAAEFEFDFLYISAGGVDNSFANVSGPGK